MKEQIVKLNLISNIDEVRKSAEKLIGELSEGSGMLLQITKTIETIAGNSKIGEMFGGISDKIGLVVNTFGELNSKMDAAKGLLSTFSSLKENIGGVVSSVGGLFSSLGPMALMIGGIVLLVVGIIAILKNLYDTNEEFRAGVDNIIATIKPVIESFFETIGSILEVIMEVLKNLFENVIMPLADFLITVFKVAWDIISAILINVIIPIITNLIETISWLWFNVLKPLADFLINAFLVAWEGISFIFENILLPAINIVIETFTWLWNNVLKPICDFFQSVFKAVFETVCKSIGERIDAIKRVFEGIISFVKGIFSADWEQVWESVKEIFSGIWDGLSGIVKTPLNLIIDIFEGFINKIIDGWNWMKKQINKFKITIPDWLGGGSVGFNLKMSDPVKLPRFANGGFPVRGSMFIAGESGPEIVGHIGPRTEVLNGSQISGAIYNAVVTAMIHGGKQTSEIDVHVHTDEGTIVDRINQRTKQTGSCPINIPI